MLNGQLTIDFLRTIIVEELDLDERRVNVYNQKFIIPNDDGLFVTIGYKGAPHIISSRNSVVNVVGIPTEQQDLNTEEHLYISLFSRNLEALQRKEEAVMALYSIYSSQIQETNSFRIFRNAPISDLSFLEASAILYRFDIDLIIYAWYQKTKTSAFYDSYNTFIRVNDGQPDMTAEVTLE